MDLEVGNTGKGKGVCREREAPKVMWARRKWGYTAQRGKASSGERSNLKCGARPLGFSHIPVSLDPGCNQE